MTIRKEALTPKQFDVLTRTVYEMEWKGYGPEATVIEACKRAGITPPAFGETIEIKVDHQ